ncbi:MAG: hypothetical protein M1832_001715 [Thelocarpon impressellum]|nr:MAG: hypothetical protein M1832_001715 [Thelocarpon impressellum]
MVDPDDPDLTDRIRSWARNKAHASIHNPFAADAPPPVIPLTCVSSSGTASVQQPREAAAPRDHGGPSKRERGAAHAALVDESSRPPSHTTAPPADIDAAQGSSSALGEKEESNIGVRFYRTTKMILFSSWLNLLLVFVPIGIATKLAHVSPNIVFAMNAIAIVPLAGLLSYATESVARRMGDTVGALMNVTFGNAVELIIFIALVKNEIRIVQASLLGSILANLLLILGMGFLVGGLRFREQIYNSTVTQMSACLLSLSVMSLLLPILLVVYGLYLLFQLKSHAYMYESTPQHIIDEESHPGFLADIMGNSSSSDSTSSSESGDSETSSGSHTTAGRIRRVMRKRRLRRKSSVSSRDVAVLTPATVTDSAGSSHHALEVVGEDMNEASNGRGPGDEAASSDGRRISHGDSDRVVRVRDFEKSSPQPKFRPEKAKKAAHSKDATVNEKPPSSLRFQVASGARLGLPHTTGPQPANVPPANSVQASMRPFNLRHISLVGSLPRTFSSTGSAQAWGASPNGPSAPAPAPRAPFSIRRTSSLPERLDQHAGPFAVPVSQALPYIMPVNVSHLSLDSKGGKNGKKYISKTTAVVLLVVSTGLVALCADFLVESIDYLVENSAVSEAFVGLIILPIVGNAAEHITAVTVAAKNKMDLAIGVAVGSSIQIALFLTPVIVLLGWILNKDMSLYFSLFETISLFVSAFIVNFLVLDGRSNYLEGALLCAAYIIIALAAFFFPDSSQQSSVGGSPEAPKLF